MTINLFLRCRQYVFQETSSRRLPENVFKTSSMRRPQDIFQGTSSRRLPGNVLKTTSRRLPKNVYQETSSRRCLPRDVLTTSLRRLKISRLFLVNKKDYLETIWLFYLGMLYIILHITTASLVKLIELIWIN